MVGAGAQVKVDKSRAGDLDLVEVAAVTHVLDKQGSDISRTLASGLGQPHGDVAGEVAVARVTRALERTDDGQVGGMFGQLWQFGQGGIENVGN